MRLFLIFLLVRMQLCAANGSVTQITDDFDQNVTTLAQSTVIPTSSSEMVLNGITGQLETSTSQNQSLQSQTSGSSTNSSEAISTENMTTVTSSQPETTISQNKDHQSSTTKEVTTETPLKPGELPVGKEECNLSQREVTSLERLNGCGIINGDLIISGQHVEINHQITTTIAEIRGCLQIKMTKLNMILFITEKTKVQRKCMSDIDKNAVTVIKDNQRLWLPENVYINLRRQVGGSATIDAIDDDGKYYDTSKFYGILCSAEEVLTVNPRKGCEEIAGDLVFNTGKPLFRRFREVVTVHGRIIVNNTNITEFTCFRALRNVFPKGKGPAILVSNNLKLKKLWIPFFSTNTTYRAVVAVNNGDYRMPLDEFASLENFFGKNKLMIPVAGNRTGIYQIEYQDNVWTNVLIYGVFPAIPPALLGLGLLMILALCSHDGSTT